MITQHPPAISSIHSGIPRTTLVVMPGGRDAPGAPVIADRLASETDILLENLEQTVARLALAHRACTARPEDQSADDEAFSWVQQSLEDISATLRGISLGRRAADEGTNDAPLHMVTGLA